MGQSYLIVLYSFLVLELIVHVSSGCSTTLITDNSAFTASSHAVGNEPWKARLEGNSWCSTVLTTSNYTLLPWIQVTLNTTYMIHYIGVAGYNKAGRFNDDYIANYHVLYGSVNDSQLQYVIEENESCPKIFPRYHNAWLQFAQLSTPVIAQVIRIMSLPGSWNNNKVCVRFQVYGCNYDKRSSTGATAANSTSTTENIPTTSNSIVNTAIVSAKQQPSTNAVVPSSVVDNGNAHLIGVAIGSAFSGIVLATLVMVSIFCLILVVKKFKGQKYVRKISEHQVSNTLNGYELQAVNTIKEYNKLTREVSAHGSSVEEGSTVMYESMRVGKRLEYDYVRTDSSRVLLSQIIIGSQSNDNLHENDDNEEQIELNINNDGMVYNVFYGISVLQ